jgi:hypothetical protein
MGFELRCRFLAIGLLAAFLAVGAQTGQAQLFYEDFEDTTLATNGSQLSGTIGGGIISYNDTSATNRARFVVVQNFTDPVMTFSYDVKAPVTNVSGFDHELTFRAGNLTTANTLSSTEFVMEVIAFRTSNSGTTGGPRAPYLNNGNETIFIVANNQATDLSFASPVDGSNVTLTGNQYISYVRNNMTTPATFGVLKAATSFTTPTCPTCAGTFALQRFGVGSSSNGHQGTFALDNVRVVLGVDLIGPGPLVPGDVNGDGFVLIDDFNIIKDNFRKTPRSRPQGDLTGDALVSLVDFAQWKANFTGGGGSTAGLDFSFLSVPEPSTLVLVAMVCWVASGRWTRCRAS